MSSQMKLFSKYANERYPFGSAIFPELRDSFNVAWNFQDEKIQSLEAENEELKRKLDYIVSFIDGLDMLLEGDTYERIGKAFEELMNDARDELIATITANEEDKGEK